MTAERLAQHLDSLRINAGKPTIRELARKTGCGKTTVGDALTGRIVPTWDIIRALVNALEGNEADVAEAKVLWSAAKGAAIANEDQVQSWLISVAEEGPGLPTGRGVVAACVLAQDDPVAAIRDGWEVIRVSALQLSALHYKDVPGSWSSNVVDTIRRARDDGMLPAGTAEQAKLLHHMYVDSVIPDPEARISSQVAVQYVCLAYRLAWLIWQTAHPRDNGSS